MKIRKTAAETPALLPEQTDPELGLTGAQVQLRLEGGFAAGDAPGVNKTNKEIILAQCFTFFNLIFLIMGLLLLAAGSSVLNMGFLLGRTCSCSAHNPCKVLTVQCFLLSFCCKFHLFSFNL